MRSFEDIRSDFLSYASSQGIEGVATDKLCSLLAYSVYKNQVLQVRDVIEASFSSATSLNSRIHHAANYQYSVPRGRCPLVNIYTLKALQTKVYNHLDYIMPFEGYYFYINLTSKDKFTKFVQQGEIYDIQLLCSSYQLREAEAVTSGDVYFVDFITAENVSSDYLLYLLDNSGVKTLVSPSEITEDASEFYYKTESGIDGSGNPIFTYKFRYLAVTIPNYGLRIIRHSDSPDWESSSLVIEYLPYNETSPDFSSLRVVTGFTLVDDPVTGTYSTIKVSPFVPRLTSLSEIYSNATSSYLQQGSVATPEDLLIALKKFNPDASYRVYTDTKITYNPSGSPKYTISQSATTATVVYYTTSSVTYQEVQAACVDSFRKSLSVPNDILVVPAEAKKTDETSTQVKLQVYAYSPSSVLTNDALSDLCESYKKRLGEVLDHSMLEADIIRLGFSYVKVYNYGTNTEATFKIVCAKYQYPDISAEVKQ